MLVTIDEFWDHYVKKATAVKLGTNKYNSKDGFLSQINDRNEYLFAMVNAIPIVDDDKKFTQVSFSIEKYEIVDDKIKI